MGALSPGHLIILLVVLLIVFGAKKLPELGRGLGQGLREFKGSVTGDDEPPRATADPPAADGRDGEDALAELSPSDAVAARQTTPAPTPEVAAAEEESRVYEGSRK